jgi:hypothetical protein
MRFLDNELMNQRRAQERERQALLDVSKSPGGTEQSIIMDEESGQRFMDARLAGHSSGVEDIEHVMEVRSVYVWSMRMCGWVFDLPKK